jgi:hypothetical protein
VVGLYIDPPAKAIVLCVDEKPSIQALERAQGSICAAILLIPFKIPCIRSKITRDITHVRDLMNITSYLLARPKRFELLTPRFVLFGVQF